jgi:hypothetical protein
MVVFPLIYTYHRALNYRKQGAELQEKATQTNKSNINGKNKHIYSSKTVLY